MTDKPPCEEDMTDLTDEAVKALLDGATPGRRVQFHGSYCPEAVGTPFTDWDTSHDMSVIRPDGSRYRLAHYKHASDAYLSQMAPDLARALLDARAELARVKTDAAVAVAEAIRRAAENKEQLDIWAQEILEGLSFADVLKITSYDDKIEAHNMVGRGLVDVILNLAPADALAEVQRLRVEARENAMQALASMGQAQEAYEAQLEAEAELARVRADAAAAQAMVVERAAKVPRLHAKQLQQNGLTAMSSDFDHIEEDIRALTPEDAIAEVEKLRAEIERLQGLVSASEAHRYRVCGELLAERDRLAAELAAAQQREAVAYRDGWRFAYQQCLATGIVPDPDYKGGATLTPTDPGDGWTWNERLGWIGPDGKPADPRRRG